jgi:hypothetical protein
MINKIYFASKGQIARLHIAKKELKLDDEMYRKNLAAYINFKTGEPVNHANELTSQQANALLNIYKSAGWVEKEGTGNNNKWSRNKGRLKYEELVNRNDEWPTPARLRLIEYKWRQHSREKTDAALQRFLKNKFGIADITWVKADQVNKIIKAIESLNVGV